MPLIKTNNFIKRSNKYDFLSNNNKKKSTITNTVKNKKIVVNKIKNKMSTTVEENYKALLADYANLKSQYEQLNIYANEMRELKAGYEQIIIENKKLKECVNEISEYNETLVNKNTELVLQLDNPESENMEYNYENSNNKEGNNESLRNSKISMVDLSADSDVSDFPNISSGNKRKKRKKKSADNTDNTDNNNSNNIIIPPINIIKYNNTTTHFNNTNLTNNNNDNNSSVNTTKTTSHTNLTTEMGQKEKIPPIVVYKMNVKDIITKLNLQFGKNNFNIKKINQNVSHIITTNTDNFIKAMKIIKEAKNNFYTYTPSSLKQHSIILKGIDSSFSEEDIRGEFQILQVSQYITKFSKYFPKKKNNNSPPNSDSERYFWLLQLAPNTNLSIFNKIKYMLHQTVKFEKFRRQETIQCKNCQRYGHAASNCGMQYRCVKCAENHGPGNCTKIDRTVDAFCVNCNSNGHPANYRKCPKYSELMDRKKLLQQKLEQQRVAKGQMYSHYLKPNVSYAKVATNVPSLNIQPITNKKPDENNQWDQTCSDLFGLDFTGTLTEFINFMPRFNAITDPLIKKVKLFEFFAKVTSS